MERRGSLPLVSDRCAGGRYEQTVVAESLSQKSQNGLKRSSEMDSAGLKKVYICISPYSKASRALYMAPAARHCRAWLLWEQTPLQG